MERVINLAVWGLGKHALNRILPAINLAKQINLYGVCTRNQSVLKNTSQQYQCLAFDSENALLNDNNVDVVYLATPIGLHYAQGKSVLNANKHLWCEKPLVNQYEQACELIDLAKSKGVSLFEALMYLYHPQCQQIKRYIASNTNKIQLIESRFTIPTLDKPGFRHNPELGGSALYDIGCYPLSLAQELVGEQDIEIKYCEIRKDTEHSIDIYGNVLLEFSNGIEARLDWGMGLAYENAVSILGVEGRLLADKIFSKPDNYEADIIIYDRYGQQVEQKYVSSNQFVAMFESFAEKMTNTLAIDEEYNKIRHRANLLEDIKRYMTT